MREKDTLEEGVSVKTMPNDILLAEVRRLVAEGHPVTLRVKGNSMLPFIYGGKDNVRFVKPQHSNVRDIVLAEISSGVYVAHRIIAIDGDRVTLMGDGNVAGTEHCRLKDLAAKVEVIIRDGREINPYTRQMMRYAELWWRLRGVRRWLLAVLRRTLLRSKVQKI